MPNKIKFPSSFIKDRRNRLGFDSWEVAQKVDVAQETYRQWEHRGELPEAHFPKLAAALSITVNELKAEKIATLAQAMLGIPKEETHSFIARALRE